MFVYFRLLAGKLPGIPQMRFVVSGQYTKGIDGVGIDMIGLATDGIPYIIEATLQRFVDFSSRFQYKEIARKLLELAQKKPQVIQELLNNGMDPRFGDVEMLTRIVELSGDSLPAAYNWFKQIRPTVVVPERWGRHYFVDTIPNLFYIVVP